jgi:hypothetical protein
MNMEQAIREIVDTVWCNGVSDGHGSSLEELQPDKKMTVDQAVKAILAVVEKDVGRAGWEVVVERNQYRSALDEIGEVFGQPLDRIKEPITLIAYGLIRKKILDIRQKALEGKP